MTTLTFYTAADFNSFAKANRANIIKINDMECGPIYPMLNLESTKHVSFYNPYSQDNDAIRGPWIVSVK